MNSTTQPDQPVDELTFEQKLRFEILAPFWLEMDIVRQEDLARNDNIWSDKSHIYTKTIGAITELCQAECNRVLAAQRQALRDEMMGALPKKQYPIGIVVGEQNNKAAFNQGFNEVITQLRTAIQGIFEGKEQPNE